MKIRAVIITLMCMCGGLQAGITFGGSGSSFVAEGGSLTFASQLPVIDGGFTVTQESAFSGTIAGTRATIRVDDGATDVHMKLTGVYDTNSGVVTLGTQGDALNVVSGQTKAGVEVNADVTVQGNGTFGDTITVASGATATLSLPKTLNVNLNNSGTVALGSDLSLADGVWFASNGGTLDGAGRTLTLGSQPLTMQTSQVWKNLKLVQQADVTLTRPITLASDVHLEGNGHALDLSSSSSALYLNGFQLEVTNGELKDMHNSLMGNNGTLSLKNTMISDRTGGSFVVNHCDEVSAANGGSFFAKNVGWNALADITLTSDARFSNAATWTCNSDLHVHGDGHAFDLTDGKIDANNHDAYFSNIKLTGMVNASLGNEGLYHFSNVDVCHQAAPYQSINISGLHSTINYEPARVSVGTGDLFFSEVSYENGVEIELLSGAGLGANGSCPLGAGAQWTFKDNAVIRGNSNILDLSAPHAKLIITNGKTLTLSNLILKGWGGSNGVGSPAGGQITFGSQGGRLILKNVTVVLDGDVTFVNHQTDKQAISIEGATNFITGAYRFDASATSADNVINDVVITYDTRGTADRTNVDLGTSYRGGGSVSGTAQQVTGGITYSADNTDLSQTEFLYHADGLIKGNTVTIETNDNPLAIDGHGRSWIMSKAPESTTEPELVTINGSGTVTTRELTIDGVRSRYFKPGDGALQFGDKTSLYLKEDDKLAQPYTFTDSRASSNLLDLGGRELDLNNLSLTITNAQAGSSLTIANGRLTGVKGSLLNPTSSNIALTLENLDMVLAGDATFNHAALTIKGDCSLSGTADYRFTNSSSLPLTIGAGSSLTVANGMTYAAGALHVIAFDSRNAKLALKGATLDATAATSSLSLTHGTLSIDGTSTLSGDFAVGGTVESGDNLDIDMDPAALVRLTNGTLTYNNEQ